MTWIFCIFFLRCSGIQWQQCHKNLASSPFHKHCHSESAHSFWAWKSISLPGNTLHMAWASAACYTHAPRRGTSSDPGWRWEGWQPRAQCQVWHVHLDGAGEVPSCWYPSCTGKIWPIYCPSIITHLFIRGWGVGVGERGGYFANRKCSCDKISSFDGNIHYGTQHSRLIWFCSAEFRLVIDGAFSVHLQTKQMIGLSSNLFDELVAVLPRPELQSSPAWVTIFPRPE